jgi:DNA-binding cell septation regulator SpoVG
MRRKMNVERIEITNDLEKRVAFASVKIGEVVINGVTVWRSPQGRLRVFFPSFRRTVGYDDVVSLAPDLRADVEAEVIAAYKAQSDAQKKEKSHLPSL